MILSVEKAKEFVSLDGWTDAKIEMKLKAIEQTIRQYTSNNFQRRAIRRVADVLDGVLYVEALTPFEVGETVQISDSALNEGLYTVTSVDDSFFTVAESLQDEKDVLVTKVEYPADVVDCCVKLLEWDKSYGGKVGVKSETLSRHSVTYEDSVTLYNGYPVGILKGLNLYGKARF